VLDGGAGTDVISLLGGTTGANFTLVSGAGPNLVDLTSIGLGNDSYANIEGMVGTDFNETLNGDGINNLIDGGKGVTCSSVLPATTVLWAAWAPTRSKAAMATIR
jgi:hypothetical protein